MNVLAICGSLRTGSSNAALLRATAGLAPEGMVITLYEGLAALPHFNPDLDLEGAIAPAAVADLRARLATSDGVIISSPEYAHGVPGSLKNALDWIVSSDDFSGKPVILINASPSGGQHAQASLMETLRMMNARVLVDASLLAPFARKKLNPDGKISDPELARALRASLEALAVAGTHPGEPTR